VGKTARKSPESVQKIRLTFSRTGKGAGNIQEADYPDTYCCLCVGRAALKSCFQFRKRFPATVCDKTHFSRHTGENDNNGETPKKSASPLLLISSL